MSSPCFERRNLTLIADSTVSGTRTALVAMVGEAAAASMMPAPRSSQTAQLAPHKARFEMLDLRGVSHPSALFSGVEMGKKTNRPARYTPCAEIMKSLA